MERILIGLGLVLIPFYAPSVDPRGSKLLVALGIGLSLALWVFYKHKIKPLGNKWIYMLMGFLFLNVIFAPKINFKVIDAIISSFWLWITLGNALVFFLMLVAVRSIEITKEQINKLLLVSVWVGFILSLYGILQFFGIEQFFVLSDSQEALTRPSSRMAATMGHPTFLASLLVMIIPLALYLKKYWFAFVMALALVLTRSYLAIFSLAVAVAFFYLFKNKIIIISIFLLLSLGFAGIISTHLISDNGRFGIWEETIKDINSPFKEGFKKFPITGMGIGSYKYLFHLKHPAKYVGQPLLTSAHNEYLQFTYEAGIIGGVLLIFSILYVFISNFFAVDTYRIALLSSFLGICICASGYFVWQLAPTIFYTIFIIGLLEREDEVIT